MSSHCRIAYDGTVRGSAWSPRTTQHSVEHNTSKVFCTSEAVVIGTRKHTYVHDFSTFIYIYQHMHTADLKVIHKLVGLAVAQLVEALHYKTEGRGLDSRWCH